jgi:tetratricopeptide (TPR) repeat protein
MHIVRTSRNLLVCSFGTLLALCTLVAEPILAAGYTKPKMLLILRQTPDSRLNQQALRLSQSNPDESFQLAVDLAFHAWASRSAGCVSEPFDVARIARALAQGLANKTVNWAVEYFATYEADDKDRPLPPMEEPRVEYIFRLKLDLLSALDYRRSARIEAVDSLESLLRLCRKLSLDLSEALVLKLLGDVHYYDLERFSSAEAYYERAAWTYAAYQFRAMLALTHEDWGMLSLSANKHSSASRHYVEAARQWEQLASQVPKAPRYLESAGLAYVKASEARMAAGDVAGAEQILRAKALVNIRNWSELSKSYRLLITTLFKLAEIRRILGDPSDSLNLLRQAQKACEREQDLLLLAQLFEELDKTYAALNQTSNQKSAQVKRLRILSETAARGELVAKDLSNYSSRLDSIDVKLLSQIEQAALACQVLGNYVRAATLWRQQAEIFGKMGRVDEQLRCLRASASALESDGQHDKALDVRRSVVLLARAIKRNDVAVDVTQEIVRSFSSQGDITNALEGLTELVQIVEQTGNVRGAARVLESRAALLAQNGNYEAAIDDYQMAMKRYVNQAGDLWSGGRLALALAQVQRQANQIEAGCATLDNAIRRIEAIYGSEGTEQEWGPERSELIANLYKNLARLYVLAGKPEYATNLISKARRYSWFSRAVSELAGDTSEPAVAKWAKTVEIVPPEDILKQLEGLVDKGSDTNWARYAQVCWWLESQYPSDYKALPVDPIDLIRFRGKIPEDHVLLEYMLTDSSVYAFLCAKDMLLSSQIGVSRSTLLATIDRLRKVLVSCEDNLSAGIPIPPVTNWQDSALAEVKQCLADLYSFLFAPIMESVGKGKNLIIALPTELRSVPLHAVVTGERDGSPVFLLEDFQVTYVGRGMLSLIADDSDKPIDPATDFVWIFADPEGNLPGARSEAARVKDAYICSRWFVGPERATATNFINALLKGGILHVAAHHRMEANSFGFQLRLAGDAKSDGTIGIQELSRVECSNVKLVVLSACETTASLDPMASDLGSAAELFVLAGAKAVMGSLWKISDEAASEAMGVFYRELSQGKGRAQSLRSAILALMRSGRYAHPFYWACFALYGSPK